MEISVVVGFEKMYITLRKKVMIEILMKQVKKSTTVLEVLKANLDE